MKTKKCHGNSLALTHLSKRKEFEDEVQDRLYSDSDCEYATATVQLITMVKNNFRYLAYKYRNICPGSNLPEIAIANTAVVVGIRLLWHIARETAKISGKAFRLSHEHGNNPKWHDKDSFDLGTSEFTKYFGKFPEKDLAQIRKLSQELGLPFKTVFNLCLIAGLLKSDKITVKDSNTFYHIISRFLTWLDRREANAKYYIDLVQSTMNEQVENNSKRKILDDILKLKAHRIDMDKNRIEP